MSRNSSFLSPNWFYLVGFRIHFWNCWYLLTFVFLSLVRRSVNAIWWKVCVKDRCKSANFSIYVMLILFRSKSNFFHALSIFRPFQTWKYIALSRLKILRSPNILFDTNASFRLFVRTGVSPKIVMFISQCYFQQKLFFQEKTDIPFSGWTFPYFADSSKIEQFLCCRGESLVACIFHMWAGAEDGQPTDSAVGTPIGHICFHIFSSTR